MADHLIAIPDGLTQLPTMQQTGIYFLYQEGVVVYVGQSVNITQRVAQHIADGAKVFDAASFIVCPKCDLNRLERGYIEQLAPKYNSCRLAKFVRRVGAVSAPTNTQRVRRRGRSRVRYSDSLAP